MTRDEAHRIKVGDTVVLGGWVTPSASGLNFVIEQSPGMALSVGKTATVREVQQRGCGAVWCKTDADRWWWDMDHAELVLPFTRDEVVAAVAELAEMVR